MITKAAFTVLEAVVVAGIFVGLVRKAADKAITEVQRK